MTIISQTTKTTKTSTKAPKAPAPAKEKATPKAAAPKAPAPAKEKATPKAAAPKAAAPKAPAPAKEKATGRVSKYATQAFYPTEKAKASNPRREGSHGFKSLEIIRKKPGINYADFIAAGGRAVDLKWDIEHIYVTTVAPKAAAPKAAAPKAAAPKSRARKTDAHAAA